MKTRNYLFVALMGLLSLSLLSACGDKESKESCKGEDLGEDFGCPVNVNAVATFCSDGVNNSYYTYDGEKYSCAGVESNTCDAALAAIGVKLTEKGCATKQLDIERELTKLAENLLLEVKSQSLCN